MMASYQDVTLTDAQTHEILCGFSTLLDARCVIVEAALARSKAFHRWRRSAAQPVVTPKGSTPKPTLATVAEAAEDATPRKRRRTPLKERFGLENVGHAADDKAPTPRSRQPVSPVPFDGARRSRQPASPLPVDRAPARGRASPCRPCRRGRASPRRPCPPRRGGAARRRRATTPTCRRRGRRRRAGPASPASAPGDPESRRRPSKSEIKAPAPKEKNVTPRKRRRDRADSDDAAPEAPARRLAAPAGEADGAGFSEAFREARQRRAAASVPPRQPPPPPDSPGVTPPAFVSDASPRFTPAARISPSTPAEQAGAFRRRARQRQRRLRRPSSRRPSPRS
ncbi:hypothetical protein JL721_8132 [Aureococcus anophagefferens]|nr:hypothetical protein JL721_8132 [Aureococcus anophagefferens]